MMLIAQTGQAVINCTVTIVKKGLYNYYNNYCLSTIEINERCVARIIVYWTVGGTSGKGNLESSKNLDKNEHTIKN